MEFKRGFRNPVFWFTTKYLYKRYDFAFRLIISITYCLWWRRLFWKKVIWCIKECCLCQSFGFPFGWSVLLLLLLNQVCMILNMVFIWLLVGCLFSLLFVILCLCCLMVVLKTLKLGGIKMKNGGDING